jgi:hypothetical protein
MHADAVISAIAYGKAWSMCAVVNRERRRPVRCVWCGKTEGTINQVDIAWPNERRENCYEIYPRCPWPRMKHFELWLHAQCEAACIKHLENGSLVLLSFSAANAFERPDVVSF